MRIDSDGYRFFGISAVLSAAAFVWFLRFDGGIAALIPSILFAVFSVYVLWFFRDPSRATEAGPDSVISPADGVVVDAAVISADGFEGGKALRVAVFMNVFNVHVNRAPFAGTVVGTKHVPGKKLSAFNERAEYENEYGDTDMETRFGHIRIRQIAGLIARRVVTRIKSGDNLKRGDRIGLIRFGSRVDVFLPADFKATVSKGVKVSAGVTEIARPTKS